MREEAVEGAFGGGAPTDSNSSGGGGGGRRSEWGRHKRGGDYPHSASRPQLLLFPSSLLPRTLADQPGARGNAGEGGCEGEECDGVKPKTECWEAVGLRERREFSLKHEGTRMVWIQAKRL